MFSGSGSPPPVRRLWLAVLCGYLALGATLQILPPFVRGHFGAGPFAAATLVGIAFAATAVVRPFAGREADRGASRPVVLAGAILVAVAALGQRWAPNVELFAAARLVMGAGEAALFSGALPWVLSAAEAEHRGRVAGWFGLSMWGGLAAGPALATLLGATAGLNAVWVGICALGVAAAALVATTQSPAASSRSEPTRKVAQLIPRGAALPGLSLGLASYGYGALSGLLILYLQHDGIGGDQVALPLFALAFLLTRLAGSPLVDRFGGIAVALVSLLCEAVGLVMLATSTGSPAALGGTILSGAGLALIYPASVATTLRRSGTMRPGIAVGATTSCWDLGVLLAGVVAGLIAQLAGYRLAFASAALVALVGVITVLGPLRRGTKAPGDAAEGGTEAPMLRFGARSEGQPQPQPTARP